MDNGDPDTDIGIMVMGRDMFDGLFGSRYQMHTIISLALTGKPTLLPVKTFG